MFDSVGQLVPYVGGTAQVQSLQSFVDSGATFTIEEFDLAENNYLRRPGEYTVVYRNAKSFTFRLLENPELDDGQLVGKLLPLVKEKWMLVSNPNYKGSIRPGFNRDQVNGRQVIFQHSPTGVIRDIALIWFWFSEKEAPLRKDQPQTQHPPESVYVGKIDRWHVYVHLDDRGKKRWPTVLNEVRRALEVGRSRARL